MVFVFGFPSMGVDFRKKIILTIEYSADTS
jgi:hypothetical protein